MWIFFRWDLDESVVEEIYGETVVDKREETVAEENKVTNSLINYCNEFVFQKVDEDDMVADDTLEISSDTLTPPATVNEQVETAVETAKKGESARCNVHPGLYGDAFMQIPNTLPIQHLLPSGCRGFGRGLAFTPEGELLHRMKRFSNIFRS